MLFYVLLLLFFLSSFRACVFGAYARFIVTADVSVFLRVLFFTCVVFNFVFVCICVVVFVMRICWLLLPSVHVRGVFVVFTVLF